MIAADQTQKNCFTACKPGTYCSCAGKTTPDYSALLKPIGEWEKDIP